MMRRSSAGRRSRAASLFTMLMMSAAASTACVAPVDQDEQPFEQHEDTDQELGLTKAELVANNADTTIAGEPAVPSAGFYRPVLRAPGCTATIVAPHLAVSANHCGTPPRLFYDDGTSFNVTMSWMSPYLRDPYVPEWWKVLNDRQKAASGGRQDDWPAMHDIAVLFLPDLTAEWLAQQQVQPVQTFVDHAFTQGDVTRMPFIADTAFWSVGLSGDQRHFGRVRFLPATVDSITGFPRDGFITRDGAQAGYVQPRPGDSGGPTFWEGPNGHEFTPFPVLVGTNQNGCPGRGPGGRNDASNRNVEGCTFGGDIAPIGAFDGMTANQKATAIKNALWVRGRIADRDGDGVTNTCDEAPRDPTNYRSRCNAPLQVVPVSGAPEMPVAGLLPSNFERVPQAQANSDWVRAADMRLCGISGNSGWLVDSLQLHYCQRSRITRSASGTFGGSGGGHTQEFCPAGWWIERFNVWTDHAGPVHARLTALQPVCTDGASTIELSVHGRERGTLDLGVKSTLSCEGSGKPLKGLLARQDGQTWLSSVYPICED